MRYDHAVRRIALVLAAGACAHGGGGARTPSTIDVGGTGTVMGTPDVAVLRIGVQAEAPSVADARQRAAQAMGAMLDALRRGGVAEKDVQTSRLSVEPRYRYSERAPELTGFLVTNGTTVKVRAIDRTGALLDAALAAGGNEARLESISFTIDDPSALESRARQAAVAEARRKAGTLAAAAGVRLGPPLSISEGSPGPTPVAFVERAALKAEAAPTPVQPGELEVRVDVRVVFRIDDGR
jgi:uncharacterized protein